MIIMGKVSFKYSILFFVSYVFLIFAVCAMVMFLPGYLNDITRGKVWFGLIAMALCLAIAVPCHLAGKKKRGNYVVSYLLGIIAAGLAFVTYYADAANKAADGAAFELNTAWLEKLWIPAAIMAGVVLLRCVFSLLKKAGAILNAVLVVLNVIVSVAVLALWLSQRGTVYPVLWMMLAADFSFGICILSYITDPVYPLQQISMSSVVFGFILGIASVFFVLRTESMNNIGTKIQKFIDDKIPQLADKIPYSNM